MQDRNNSVEQQVQGLQTALRSARFTIEDLSPFTVSEIEAMERGSGSAGQRTAETTQNLSTLFGPTGVNNTFYASERALIAKVISQKKQGGMKPGQSFEETVKSGTVVYTDSYATLTTKNNASTSYPIVPVTPMFSNKLKAGQEYVDPIVTTHFSINSGELVRTVNVSQMAKLYDTEGASITLTNIDMVQSLILSIFGNYPQWATITARKQTVRGIAFGDLWQDAIRRTDDVVWYYLTDSLIPLLYPNLQWKPNGKLTRTKIIVAGAPTDPYPNVGIAEKAKLASYDLAKVKKARDLLNHTPLVMYGGVTSKMMFQKVKDSTNVDALRSIALLQNIFASSALLTYKKNMCYKPRMSSAWRTANIIISVINRLPKQRKYLISVKPSYLPILIHEYKNAINIRFLLEGGTGMSASFSETDRRRIVYNMSQRNDGEVLVECAKFTGDVPEIKATDKGTIDERAAKLFNTWLADRVVPPDYVGIGVINSDLMFAKFTVVGLDPYNCEGFLTNVEGVDADTAASWWPRVVTHHRKMVQWWHNPFNCDGSLFHKTVSNEGLEYTLDGVLTVKTAIPEVRAVTGEDHDDKADEFSDIGGEEQESSSDDDSAVDEFADDVTGGAQEPLKNRKSDDAPTETVKRETEPEKPLKKKEKAKKRTPAVPPRTNNDGNSSAGRIASFDKIAGKKFLESEDTGPQIDWGMSDDG